MADFRLMERWADHRLRIAVSVSLTVAVLIAFVALCVWQAKQSKRKRGMEFEGVVVGDGSMSLTSGTTTVFVFGSSLRDSGDYFNAGYPDRISIPNDGWYEITAHTDWDELTADAMLKVTVTKNGDDTLNMRDSRFCKSGHKGGGGPPPKQFYLNQNDTISVSNYQNTGAGLGCSTTLTVEHRPDPTSPPPPSPPSPPPPGLASSRRR